MKKLLFLAILCTSVFFVKAQNTFPASGYVGIGTNSPGFPLDIVRPQYSNGALRIEGNSNITGMPSINFYNNGDGTSANLAWDGTRFNFTTNLSVAGNVGINSSSPPTIGNYGTFALNGRSPSQGGYMSFQTNGSELGAIVSNSQFNIQTAANIITQFLTGGNQTMQISATGNVLINKVTQSNSNYKLDVAGPVRADAIIVNTTGADFVFEDSYRLKKLSEVNDYINHYKHLPEIPSAVEMQQNGTDLGEMNIKLLKKVEELTLYLIGKDKQMQLMQKDINRLKRKNH